MSYIQSVKEIKGLKNKRVLVRVDFNVPVKNKKVVEDSRIRASVPTIQYLQKKGAKVILVTHVGRPEGKVVAEFSVQPVAKRLEKIIGKKVFFLNEWMNASTGSAQQKKLQQQKPGEIIMLENIRFFPGEEKNDSAFAKELASLADIFVLDGFAVAHRAAASVSGVAKYLPSYAGLLLEKEIQQLDIVLKKPKHPFVAIIGGAKIETKLPVVKNILKVADTVLLGGAVVNTYLAAHGYGVGASLVDTGIEKKSIAALSNKRVIKPVDVLVGDKQGKKVRVVSLHTKPHEICSAHEAILDIGPGTMYLFETFLKKAKTVVWNGAMGYFEVPVYATGTFEMARLLASQKRSFTLLGGGETLLVMEALHLKAKNYHISTGGGAMLEYLSGKKLPGIVAVIK